MDRRQVLAAASAGFLTTAVGATPAVALESTVRGVKIGLTTFSLRPMPKVPGKTDIEVIVDQCLELGVANIELATGTFGPKLQDADQSNVPEVITPAYERSREVLRQWRLSPATLDEYRSVRAQFQKAGLNLFSLSNCVADDCTDAEIDAMFRQMRALGVRKFQTAATRMSTAPRLAPFAARYGVTPCFHPHDRADDPNEVATAESLDRLMAMSPHFRICLDIGHFVASGNDLMAFLRRRHDRITHLHVKDRKRNGGPEVPWGTGDTPIRECLTTIRDNRWPIIALVEREMNGTGTPVEQTRVILSQMRAILES